jgi:peptidyl-prolyl cis-trans isomerase SurA
MIMTRRWQGRQRWYGWLGVVSAVWVLGWYGSRVEAAQVLDGIAAVVNEEIITISDVHDTMALEAEQLRRQYSNVTLQDKLHELYQRTLQPLIDMELQLERARKLNLSVSDEEVTYHVNKLKEQNQITDEQLQQMLQSRGLTLDAYREQVRRGLLVSKVVNHEVRSRLVIVDKELEEAYRQQQERYRIAGEVTVSHILFLIPAHATAEQEAQVQAKAAAVLQQLRHGGNFAALAKQYSEGPSADQSGLLGTFRTGELLPGFEEAVAKLQPGEISDPVRTRVGWHIIRVENKKAGDYKSFEAVKEEIREALLRKKTEQKYQEWLETLRQQAYITILYEGS